MIFSGKWSLMKKHLGIKYQIAENKKPDVFVKFKNEYYIIEAKHLKESGGSQDKQINELIKIISLSEGINYVSFLDGMYANRLLVNEKIMEYYKNRTREIDFNSTKIESQLFKIFRNIADNPSNYFVNTAGFLRLFKQ